MLISEIDGHRFAVDPGFVVEILDAPPAPVDGEDAEPLVDLAEVFGLPLGPRPRVLRLRTESETWLLKVGEHAEMFAVELSQLRNLPPFLRGFAKTHAIRGLLLQNDTVAFVVDEATLGLRGR